MTFYICENTDALARMRLDVIVYDMPFYDFMVNLKHISDRSWAENAL